MELRKELGKISEVQFGFCGYQDAQFGLSLTFSGEAWGVGTFIGGAWAGHIKADDHTQWSESDRDKQYADMCRKIDKLLSDAKVEDVYKLKGIPIEATFDFTKLQDWRILKEVL